MPKSHVDDLGVSSTPLLKTYDTAISSNSRRPPCDSAHRRLRWRNPSVFADWGRRVINKMRCARTSGGRGHAHAGVLPVLSLIALRYVDEAKLPEGLKKAVRSDVPSSAISCQQRSFKVQDVVNHPRRHVDRDENAASLNTHTA
jgi:hypothetical protein